MFECIKCGDPTAKEKGCVCTECMLDDARRIRSNDEDIEAEEEELEED